MSEAYTAEIINYLGDNALVWREKIKDRGGFSGKIINVADLDIDEVLKPMRDDEELLKLRLRNVGWEIHAKGGRDAMQRAYEEVLEKFGGGASRRIEMAWEGIAGWLV